MCPITTSFITTITTVAKTNTTFRLLLTAAAAAATMTIIFDPTSDFLEVSEHSCYANARVAET